MDRAMLGDQVRVQCLELLKDGAVARWYCGRQIEFTVGSSGLAADISFGVLGMARGEQKRVVLQPKDAYGDLRRKLIKELPRTAFARHLELYVGKTLTSVGVKSRRRRHVRVVELRPGTVVVDGNHPLAGKPLVVKLLLISLESMSRPGVSNPHGVDAKTVTQSAGLWQEITEDRQCFRQLQRDLRHVCASDRPPGAGRFAMVDLLARFRDQLGTHFALEEAFAYFENLFGAVPALCLQAEMLTAEHRKLYVQVCHLADDAVELLCRRGARATFRRIARAYRAFDERFQDHEARENELLTRSFQSTLA